MKSTTWSGRFQEPVDALVKEFTASVTFDRKLAQYDVTGSRAHAGMLHKIGVLSAQDLDAINRGLDQITQEIDAGSFNWNIDDEDVHLNIEKRLTTLIGDAGKRLHTARSRNDQVATDIRLYLRDRIDELTDVLANLQNAIVDKARTHADTIMPGYTHLQVGQPVTFGHHLMAYFEMFLRDIERLEDCRKRLNVLPLGSGALAGTTYPIDREHVAQQLGFSSVSRNSLDGVSDRDFALEFLSSVSILLTHFSRLSEEIVIWMNPRLGFVNIPDRFCTGSSIMPQKRNPDVLEIVRAKTGRALGNLVTLAVVMKAQPLAYNHDNQEDKEPLFDSAETALICSRLIADIIANIEPCSERLRLAANEGYSTATDLADYLVKRGVPFRDAHEIVARTVLYAEKSQLELQSVPLEVLKSFSSHIDESVYSVLTLEGSVGARDHVGGTAPNQVRQAVAAAATRLSQARRGRQAGEC